MPSPAPIGMMMMVMPTHVSIFLCIFSFKYFFFWKRTTCFGILHHCDRLFFHVKLEQQNIISVVLIDFQKYNYNRRKNRKATANERIHASKIISVALLSTCGVSSEFGTIRNIKIKPFFDTPKRCVRLLSPLSNNSRSKS